MKLPSPPCHNLLWKLKMSCPPVEYEDSLLKKTLILCTIMVVALLGNVLVGVVFCKVRSLRSNVNCFFVNMALSDVLFPLVAWPRILVTEYQSRQWLIGGALGNFLCPFAFFLQEVSTVVSILSLLLISVERFIAVVFPLKVRQITTTKRALCIAFTWITAIVLQSPFLYAMKLKENTNSTSCVYDWAPAFDHTKALTIFSLVIFAGCWLVPVIVMSALYTITAISMRRNNKACGQKGSLQRQKQTRKVLILAVATMMAFCICWLPFHVFVFLYLLSDLCKSTIEKLRVPAVYLGYSSTAVNPIILFTFSQKFRKGLMSIFRRNGPDNKRSTKGTVTTSTRNATVLKSLV